MNEITGLIVFMYSDPVAAWLPWLVVDVIANIVLMNTNDDLFGYFWEIESKRDAYWKIPTLMLLFLLGWQIALVVAAGVFIKIICWDIPSHVWQWWTNLPDETPVPYTSVSTETAIATGSLKASKGNVKRVNKPLKEREHKERTR